jgi:hypothetical protein
MEGLMTNCSSAASKVSAIRELKMANLTVMVQGTRLGLTASQRLAR